MSEEPRLTPVGSVEAVEAAVEGAPGALSLAPSTTVPALGGELILPDGADAAHGADANGHREGIGTDTVRAGLLQAGPLAVAGLLANGANLLVTVVLARLLTTHGYGSFNQLTGLFLIVSMPGSAVAVAVVRRVTGWRSARTVRRWAGRVHAQGTMAVLVFAVAVFIARGAIADALGQRDSAGVVAILVAGAVWILLSLDRGLLQAHRNYRVLAANLLVEGAVRVAAMLVLVAAGFGVAGAAVGVLLAEVVTCLHARVMADRVWSAQVRAERAAGAEGAEGAERAEGAEGAPIDDRRPVAALWQRVRSLVRPAPGLVGARDERRDLATDLVTAFVALSMVALLQNIDVIVVGRDSSHLSGSYAAVSVACKALVFGAIVLGGYLLPEAAIRWRQGGHALRQLVVTLLVLAVPAAALVVVSLAAPRVLLEVVFSPKYTGASAAFFPLALAMVCLSLTVVLTMYLLAVGRRWITPVLVAGGALTTLAVVHAGGHPVATARADLVVQFLLAAVILGGFVRVHQRRRSPVPS